MEQGQESEEGNHDQVAETVQIDGRVVRLDSLQHSV